MTDLDRVRVPSRVMEAIRRHEPLVGPDDKSVQLVLTLPTMWTHAPKRPTETDMDHEVSPHYDAAGRWVCNTCREEVKLG